MKIIVLIMVFSITVAFAVGAIAVKRSTSYLTVEIDEKILNTAENFSNDFSADFNHMEGLTDALVSYGATTFDMERFQQEGRTYLEGYKEELGGFIRTNLTTAAEAHSLYVTFNPELTSKSDEVWYVLENGQPKEVLADFETRDFEQPYEEDMAYFFEPIETKAGVWTGPYYDTDVDEEMFSYSRAIYVDDVFVAVAGADINADDTIRIIKDMKLYDSGYASLLDENYEFVINPKEDDAAFVDDTAAEAESIRECLKKEVELQESANGKAPDSKSAERTKRSGIIHYDFSGAEKILGFSRMDNGWTMIIVQPQAEVYAPVKSMTSVFLILAAGLAIVLIAFLIAFSAPFVRKQSALEAQNREKDILLIYQSRQAKIGEMVGNITHQWKQPLNTIKLIMANLLDSYRYGDLDEARLKKSVDKVDGIVDKMSETITDFSGFLKPTKEKESFDMQECIRTAISLMEESITYHKIHVDVVCETEDLAYGYYNEAVHVVFNILNNARDAIVAAEPEERQITVTIVRQENMVKVSVMNRGNHIPDDVKEQMFEPYFTTKEASGGTGLGLYISRQIIEERMDGRLFAENVQDGVVCGILLPTSTEKADRENDGKKKSDKMTK